MMGIIILSLLSLLLSIILVFAESLINDEPVFVEEALKMLPGYNCGACGFGSCLGMAEAMGEDASNYKKCKPMRGETLREMEMFLLKNKKTDIIEE